MIIGEEKKGGKENTNTFYLKTFFCFCVMVIYVTIFKISIIVIVPNVYFMSS